MRLILDGITFKLKAENQMLFPKQITVRLGEDFNWWVQADGDVGPPQGILDPRQGTHLKELLDAYQPFGFQPHHLAAAFHSYRIDAELGKGRLRLIADEEPNCFALPVAGEDDESSYLGFLENVRAARIRKLNAEHHYVHDCTVEEMIEELSLIDADRYFSAEVIHPFDEIQEILEWSPAQWDDSA